MEEEVKKGFDFKKYLPIIGIVLAVIILIIILVSVLGGGPKKAVKNYVGAINKSNVSKVMKVMDLKGMYAWRSSSFDVKDFSDEDYDKFIEKYEDVEDSVIEAAEESQEKSIDKVFDNIKDEYKSYKVKVEKIKSSKKLGKDLYLVKAKVSIVAKPEDEEENEEIDSAGISDFIVYKNKVIYTDLSF